MHYRPPGEISSPFIHPYRATIRHKLARAHITQDLKPQSLRCVIKSHRILYQLPFELEDRYTGPWRDDEKTQSLLLLYSFRKYKPERGRIELKVGCEAPRCIIVFMPPNAPNEYLSSDGHGGDHMKYDRTAANEGALTIPMRA